jgi:hypothetical protein
MRTTVPVHKLLRPKQPDEPVLKLEYTRLIPWVDGGFMVQHHGDNGKWVNTEYRDTEEDALRLCRKFNHRFILMHQRRASHGHGPAPV